MRDFQLPGRSPVYASNGVCATSHPIASQVALRVLQDGGNAVDAAVAAGAVLCVVEPHMTGLGGDCFAIVTEPDGRLAGYNGSGKSAKAAKTDWFLERGLDSISEDSIHAVTVPGTLTAWEALIDGHGRWGLDAALAPAIDYAEKGYVVAPRVAWDWDKLAGDLSKDPGASQHYLTDGQAPRVGCRHQAPALAKTLRAIAKNGPSAFYQGEIAAEIANVVQSYGGLLTEEDLAGAAVLNVDPIMASYRDVEVAELPPNGQGIAALVLLKLLGRFDLAGFDPHGVDRHHIQLEAGRLAYAVRDAFVTDPDHMTVSTETLLSDVYIEQLAKELSVDRRNMMLPSVVPSQSDTIYLTVADNEGRMVSFINSVYRGFGARICTPKSGVMLQNRGSCFVVDPAHPNCIDASKRPLHTIIPAIAFKNGLPWLSFGVMGGSYQAQGHAQVIANMVDYGMDPQEALDCARLFWETDGTIVAERGLAASSYEGLAARGHPMAWAEGPHGGGQIIALDRERGVYCAGSDHRKDGMALGY